MFLEMEVNYHDMRFIEIDNSNPDETFAIKPDEKYYIRQIKKHWYSRWKTVVKRNTHIAILFSESEIRDLWHGSAFMRVSIGNGTSSWKWTDYSLF